MAARALCWVSVVWSAAVLPAVVLRNVALTHRPLRMPDHLAAALDLPTASPRDLIASAGVAAPVLAALPTRLDTGSDTGAFLDPERAGPVLAQALATAPLAPDERLVLARLLAVLRAGERAGLAVWESLDTGPIAAVPEGAPTSLCWPGLARPLLAEPLTEDEWARLEGAGPWPPARVAELWHQLYRFAPDSAINVVDESVEDGSPYAILLDHLCAEAPCVPLGLLVVEILGNVAIAVDETLDRERLAPFADAVRRNSAALQRLADATRAAGEPRVAERIERITAELGA